MAKPCRVAWRKARLLWHALIGFVAVTVAWPFLRFSHRLQFERWWARRLLRLVRINVQFEFEDHQADYGQHGPMLIVGNHLSWLDVFAINAYHPVTFVAKSEIAQWPVAGTLAKNTGTLFVQRNRRTAVREVIQEAVSVLAAGRSVAVFPEGTTGQGHGTLPFHGNFVEPAVLAGVSVLPVSMQFFTPCGRFTDEPTFVGEQTFLDNVRILCESKQGYTLRLCFHTPIQPKAGVNRRQLTEQARQVIEARLIAKRASHL